MSRCWHFRPSSKRNWLSRRTSSWISAGTIWGWDFETWTTWRCWIFCQPPTKNKYGRQQWPFRMHWDHIKQRLTLWQMERWFERDRHYQRILHQPMKVSIRAWSFESRIHSIQFQLSCFPVMIILFCWHENIFLTTPVNTTYCITHLTRKCVTWSSKFKGKRMNTFVFTKTDMEWSSYVSYTLTYRQKVSL